MVTVSGSYVGGCLCGAVRYESTKSPTGAVHCHCGRCRKATGAAITTWAMFDMEHFSFAQGAPTFYESSSRMKRGFCTQCGGTLAFQYYKMPEWIGIAAGSLDDIGVISPSRHYWSDQMAPWLKLDDGLPLHKGEIRGAPKTET